MYEDLDPYSGAKTLTLEMDTGPCALPNATAPNSARVKLVVTALSNPPGPADYALFVDMTGGHSINPDRHHPLDALIDGTHDELAMLARRRKWRVHNTFSRGKHIREEIPFDVNSDFLAALANAKTFQFRVNGTDGALERCATHKDLRDLQEFLGRSATL